MDETGSDAHPGQVVDGDGEAVHLRVDLIEETQQAGHVVADEGLVGVEPGDPLPGAVFQGGVAGPGEVVVPVALDDGGAEFAGDVHGGVGRPGVVDDDLVGETLEGGQAGGDVGLFVLGDEAGRDLGHVARGLAETEAQLEAGPVRLLLGEPVEAVGVERLVTFVVDEGLVGDEEAPARRHDASAQVVVLVAADAVGRVEPADLLEGVATDGQAEADEALGLRRLAPVLLGPGPGEAAHPGARHRGGRKHPRPPAGPETKFERGPVAPTVGSSSNGTIRGSSQRPERMVSLFRKTRTSWRAMAAPSLQPPAKPWFSVVGDHLDPGVAAGGVSGWRRSTRCPPRRPGRGRRGSASGNRGRPAWFPTHSRRG